MMKNNFVCKITALVLSVCFVLCGLHLDSGQREEAVWAAEETAVVEVYPTIYGTYKNPLYRDAKVPAFEESSEISLYAEPEEYYDSLQEAAVYVRQELKKRSETITVRLKTSGKVDGTMLNEIMEKAMAHTGNPTEGDYIRWTYGGWNGSMKYYSSQQMYYLTISYTVSYYTTAAQEAQLDTAVNKLLSELQLDSCKNRYEKVWKIYSYLCENITYDYDNLDDESYKLKYTAYAALIHKTAVCQGYAILFYRLALTNGIDARVIIGDAGGPHAWNIVKLGKEYFNLDATWDAPCISAGFDPMYFLRCNANFEDHVRDVEYDTEDFHAVYPMGGADYDPGQAGAEEPELAVLEGKILNMERIGSGIVIAAASEGPYSPEISASVEPVSGTYRLTGLSDGTYRMEVSKKNYASRIYEFVVKDGCVENFDIEIHLLGDINGDGKANMQDLNRICDHIRGKNTLTGYEFVCADINGDKKAVNASDLNRICDHVRNKSSLWE